MVRCGLIGCGQVAAEMHLPALRGLPGVRLETVCETNPERRETFARRYGVPKATSDLDTFLAESPALDFVLVATPGPTHYALVRQLVEHGVHVFVEKPLALNLAECVELKRRAEARRVKVCVGQTWRYREPVLRARAALTQGLVGRIYQVNVSHHGGSLFHASEPAWSWEERRNQVLLYDHGIHLLDLAVWFAGPVEEVLAVKATVDPHLGVTTRVYVLVAHAAGAVSLVDLQLFASSNFTQFSLYGTANDVEIKFFPSSFRLYSGRVNPLDELYYDAVRIKDFLWPALAGRLRRPRVPRRAVPHFRLLQQFVRALQDPSVPVPVTIDDVLPTMDFLERLRAVVYAAPEPESEAGRLAGVLPGVRGERQ